MSETNEIGKIESILDSSIRPAIQKDGGDLSIVSLEDNILKISYKGACVGCPMATRGTLQAIQAVLQDKYSRNIKVILA